MKKIVCLVITLLMVLSLVACGVVDNLAIDSTPTENTSEVFGSEEAIDSIQTDSEENSEDSAEWKEFLKDYEAWVDDYIAIAKKQKENPTDITVLADYSKMLSDLTEWSEKADTVAESIEDTEEALEYSKEVLRIAGKLTEVGE